jgi:hypothetical protein
MFGQPSALAISRVTAILGRMQLSTATARPDAKYFGSIVGPSLSGFPAAISAPMDCIEQEQHGGRKLIITIIRGSYGNPHGKRIVR